MRTAAPVEQPGPEPAVDAAPPVVEEIAPVVESDDLAEPVATAIPAEPDPTVTARFAELEARLEEQDVALRRVLTLLVDWVEADHAPKPSPVDAHALADAPRGYAPIRGAAA